MTASDGLQDADNFRSCAHPKQLLSEASQLAAQAEAAGHAVEPDDLGGRGEGERGQEDDEPHRDRSFSQFDNPPNREVRM